MTAIGLSALGYHLPAASVSVEELAAQGLTNSSAEKLRALGYGTARLARAESLDQLALCAVQDLVTRSGFDLTQIDLILFGAGLSLGGVVDPGPDFAWQATQDPLPFFRFPGTRLQAELGLPRAQVLGVGQLACNAFQGCLRLARSVLLAEPDVRHVLCVSADRFPDLARREIVYSLMSDGACAAVVSRHPERQRILSMSQLTRGVYWDGAASHDQIISAYFPLARQAFFDALARAGLTPADLKLLIPHNITLKSWEILAPLLGLPMERVYTANISRIGHVVASDNVINYLDAVAEGRLVAGDRVALLVTGFGAHFGCLVLEV